MVFGYLSYGFGMCVGAVRIGSWNLYKKCCGVQDPLNKPQYSLLCLGMGGAGKTLAIAQMCLEPTDDIKPTAGFAIKGIQLSGVIFNVKEVAGSDKYRKYWKHYYARNDGLIYVIDATASDEDLAAAVAALNEVLNAEDLAGCPVLVLVNKQDLAGARPVDAVKEALDMSMFKKRGFSIVACSALDRTTLETPLENFSNSYYETLSDLEQRR